MKQDFAPPRIYCNLNRVLTYCFIAFLAIAYWDHSIGLSVLIVTIGIVIHTILTWVATTRAVITDGTLMTTEWAIIIKRISFSTITRIEDITYQTHRIRSDGYKLRIHTNDHTTVMIRLIEWRRSDVADLLKAITDRAPHIVVESKKVVVYWFSEKQR